MDDRSERPITFASRTLTSVEKQYSQLGKEVLAIIFGVKHQDKRIKDSYLNWGSL